MEQVRNLYDTDDIIDLDKVITKNTRTALILPKKYYPLAFKLARYHPRSDI